MNFLKRLFGGGSSPPETKADITAEFTRVDAEFKDLEAEMRQRNFIPSDNHTARLQAVKKKMGDLLARAKKL